MWKGQESFPLPGIGWQGPPRNQEFRKILSRDVGPWPGRSAAGKVIFKARVPVDFMSAHALGLACLMSPLHRSHTDWSPALLPVLPREGTGTGEAADPLINSPARLPTPVSSSPQGWNGGGGQCTEAETWRGTSSQYGRRGSWSLQGRGH